MAGLYIHIPFCAQKCIYCDFYSVVNQKLQTDYVTAVIAELALRTDEIDFNKINTVYIGGGTPSFLSVSDISRLISGLYDYVPKENICEFTFEVNPDDVTDELINTLKSCGVNRVSMGIQSFNDNELQIIRRRHTADEAINAFKTIRNNGIGNISIDLIFGLPGQTLDSFKYNIRQALNLNPEHISCYGLMYEPGTLLYKLRENGKITECEDSLYISMYTVLTKTLKENGYEHYEISNYCRDNMYSRHNTSYWKNIPYIGLGAGAHSYDGNLRRYNADNIRQYIAAVNAGHSFYTEEPETFNEKHNDYIMTQLRAKWGINLAEYQRMFGANNCDRFRKIVKGYISSGDMVCSGENYKLTESGVMLSDSIFTDLFILDE